MKYTKIHPKLAALCAAIGRGYITAREAADMIEEVNFNYDLLP